MNKNADAAAESIELGDIPRKRARDVSGAQLARTETIPYDQTTTR
jgi:hypothetical protein